MTALLRSGRVELLDVSDKLPGLIRRPGLQSWKVFDNRLERDFPDFASVPEVLHGTRAATLFPPSADEVDRFPLHRCLRLLPHDQNSGAFFVALLRKVTPCRTNKDLIVPRVPRPATASSPASVPQHQPSTDNAEAEKAVHAAGDASASTDVAEDAEFADSVQGKDAEKVTSTETAKPASGRESGKVNRQEVDGFLRLAEFEMGRQVLKRLKEYFGLKDSFPQHLLWSRNGEDLKKSMQRIYFVNEATNDMLRSCYDEESGRWVGKLRIVHAGVRMFSKSGAGSDADGTPLYRIVQDAASLMMPYVTKQAVMVPARFVAKLLEQKSISLEESPEISEGDDDDDDAKALVGTLASGPILLGCAEQTNVIVSAWKGRSKVDIMVNKDMLAVIKHSVQDVIECGGTAEDTPSSSSRTDLEG